MLKYRFISYYHMFSLWVDLLICIDFYHQNQSCRGRWDQSIDVLFILIRYLKSWPEAAVKNVLPDADCLRIGILGTFIDLGPFSGDSGQKWASNRP